MHWFLRVLEEFFECCQKEVVRKDLDSRNMQFQRVPLPFACAHENVSVQRAYFLGIFKRAVTGNNSLRRRVHVQSQKSAVLNILT